MPFGAKMSQDVLKLHMDAIFEQCPGVIGIHDDMVIFGTSNEDYDANLINLMNVCQKEEQQEVRASKGTCYLLCSK